MPALPALAARGGARPRLRFATCPTCGKRSGRGADAGRYALLVVVIAALMFALGYLYPVFDHDLDATDLAGCHTWFPLIFIGLAAITVPLAAIGEWRKLDRRVRWLGF